MEVEEEPRKGSGCAAVMVVMVFTAVPMMVLWLVSREVFILFVGAIAWGAVIWAARTKASWVLDAPNPSPDAGCERGFVEEPQVRGVTITKVGDSCTIVSHPSERRSYGVEGLGRTDPGGA